MKSKEARGDNERLENETQSMMLKYCSHSLNARKVADSSIISMAESFPQISWNKTCINTLLDLVETVGKSRDVPMVVRVDADQMLGNYSIAEFRLQSGTSRWPS